MAESEKNLASGESSRDEETPVLGKNIPGIYFCELCKRGWNNAEALENHIKEEHSGEKFYCIPCNREFQSQEELYQHNSEQHPAPRIAEPAQQRRDIIISNPYRCSLCLAYFLSQEDLDEHIDKFHTREPMMIEYQCFCGKKFLDETTLRRHRLLHGFLCPFCQATSMDHVDLFDHIVRDHHDAEYGTQCPFCDDRRSFRDSQQFVEHCERSHPEAFRFYCDPCKMGFQTEEPFFKHDIDHQQKDQNHSATGESQRQEKRKCSGTGGPPSKSKKTDEGRRRESVQDSTRSALPPPRSSSTPRHPSTIVTLPRSATTTRPGNLYLSQSVSLSTPPSTPKKQREEEIRKCKISGNILRTLLDKDRPINLNEHKCILCQERFPDEVKLNDHYIFTHYCCYNCLEKFNEKEEIISHLRECHSD